MVVGVGNEKVTRGVDGDAGRGRQLDARGGAPVAAEAGTAGAGGGRDDPGRRRDLTDAVVIRVRDEEVTRGVDGDTRRGLQLGAGGGAAVVERATAAAGDGGDDTARGRYLADAAVRGVRDEEVARGVDGDSGRDPQLGARGGAPVAEETEMLIGLRVAGIDLGGLLGVSVVIRSRPLFDDPEPAQAAAPLALPPKR